MAKAKMGVSTLLRSRSGVSLAESLVAISITAFAISAIYIGSSALQKSFKASHHYAATQAAQLRVIDYVSLDLRRAVDWKAENGGTELVLKIPNYYTGDVEDRSLETKPSPRHPRVAKNGSVYYGEDANDLVTVRYYTSDRQDSSGTTVKDVWREVIYRDASLNKPAKLLVTGVKDFQPIYREDDPKGQIVYTKISFPPSFRPFIDSGDAYRDGTTTFATTMVRNKR